MHRSSPSTDRRGAPRWKLRRATIPSAGPRHSSSSSSDWSSWCLSSISSSRSDSSRSRLSAPRRVRRHIARTVSTASGVDEARERADRVLQAVVDEYGMDAASVDLSLACVPAGATCPDAGATLVVTLRTRAPLPLIPPILGLDDIASIPVEASSAQKVSRFWGAQ